MFVCHGVSCMIDRQVARITLGRCPAYLTALLRARALLVPCLSSCAWMAALMNVPSGELFRVVLYELPPGISNPLLTKVASTQKGSGSRRVDRAGAKEDGRLLVGDGGGASGAARFGVLRAVASCRGRRAVHGRPTRQQPRVPASGMGQTAGFETRTLTLNSSKSFMPRRTGDPCTWHLHRRRRE